MDCVKVIRSVVDGKIYYGVFNPGKNVPVHCGKKYWFENLNELRAELAQKMLVVKSDGTVCVGKIVDGKNPIVYSIISWYT